MIRPERDGWGWRSVCPLGWRSRRYPWRWMAEYAARTHLRLSPQCDDRRLR